jgi:hypothetical protein
MRAVIRVESNFNPNALSPKNAQGLMQLIPETAGRFGVRDAWDPEQNLRGGMAYLLRSTPTSFRIESRGHRHPKSRPSIAMRPGICLTPGSWWMTREAIRRVPSLR